MELLDYRKKKRAMEWQPIEDLPANWEALAHPNLHSLAEVWHDQRQKMENTQSLTNFLERLRRKIAIETGVIERLYTLDRGVTRMLIEHGIDAALIPHGSTNQPVSQVVALIRDHDAAVEQVFHFVGAQRDLSTSFIKQLHQLLTRHQPYTEAVDQFGNVNQVDLLRGDWKKFPNNPTRPDGETHYYCPPEQVASQMDQLIEWHLQHVADGVSPEVEAAWLHHRFTQIHPFQDGNGRAARTLATLVFLRAGWFPLSVLDDQQTENDARNQYIQALETADQGDLQPLVNLFAAAQQRVFISSLSLSEDVIAEQTSYERLLQTAIEKIDQRQTSQSEALQKRADLLFTSTAHRLNAVSRDLDNVLRHRAKALVRFDSAAADDPRSGYYRYQVIETARIHNYQPNLVGYKSWLCLSIQLDGVQTEILISLHGLGRVMIGSACAYRRLSSDEGETSAVQDLEALSQTPFDFTTQESTAALTQRFTKWLDEVVTNGIAYWNKSL